MAQLTPGKVGFFGNWPTQVPDLCDRPVFDSFREAVQRLCTSKPGTFVVHGSGGIGETTMTAFVLRKTEQISYQLGAERFGSINFALCMNVGSITRSEEYKDSDFLSALHLSLINACLIEEGIHCDIPSLRKAFNAMGHKMLIVLDDVFQSGVLRCIANLGADIRVIALTRNQSRIRYSTDSFPRKTYAVPLINNDSMETMLADFYRLEERGLDRQRHISRLAKICLGLPLLASIVNLNFRKLQSPSKIEDKFWALIRNFKEAAGTYVTVDQFDESDEAQLRVSQLVAFSPEFENENNRRILNTFLLFESGEIVEKKDLMVLLNCTHIDELTELLQECVDASFLQPVAEAGYVMHDLLHKSISERGMAEYKCSEDGSLKRYVLMDCTSRSGLQALGTAIINERFLLVGIIAKYVEPSRMIYLNQPPLYAPLNDLARKCAAGLKIAKTGKAGTHSAFELFCIISDICLSNGADDLLSLEMCSSIEKTMALGRDGSENLFLVAINQRCSNFVDRLIDMPQFRNIISETTDCEGNNALIAAIQSGNPSVIGCLIESGLFDVNYCNRKSETALWHCVRWGGKGLCFAKTMHNKTHLEPNVADSTFGNTPLLEAVKYNDLDFVRFLVEELRADINLLSKFDRVNAVEKALAIFDRFEIGAWLLQQPDVKMSQTRYAQSIRKAKQAGKMDIVTKLLLMQDHLLRDEYFPVIEEQVASKVHEAAEDNDLALLMHLRDSDNEKFKNDAESLDEHGQTPLMIACFHEFVDVVSLLLSNCDPKRFINNSKQDDGSTALMIAAMRTNRRIASLLISSGADVNQQRKDGWTALMFASKNVNGLPVAELLLRNGANVNFQGFDVTALYLACQNGCLKTAELLLDSGALIDQETNSGWTPLMVAALKGFDPIVRLLINRGANVDRQKGDSGLTALLAACGQGNLTTAKILLDEGVANPDLTRSDGATALMLACQNCELDVAKLLLKCGANVDIQSNDGWTALMTACSKGHFDIAKLLLDNDASATLADKNGHTAWHLAKIHDNSDVFIEHLKTKGFC